MSGVTAGTEPAATAAEREMDAALADLRALLRDAEADLQAWRGRDRKARRRLWLQAALVSGGVAVLGAALLAEWLVR